MHNHRYRQDTLGLEAEKTVEKRQSDDSRDERLQSLLFERSPFGNLDAIVQHDGRAVYFYLQGNSEFGTRACWVRNLVPGPLTLNHAEMMQGIPPVLPRIYCRNREPEAVPDPEALRIVWFLEGNAAALFESQELLSVIPPWSGKEGFHGYSRDCVVENPICWPLPGSPGLRERIDAAERVWSEWQTGKMFAPYQQELLSRYGRWFGNQVEYFAIDGGKFPPRGLARYESPEWITLVTVGMSLVPQPNVELFVEEPAQLRRVELALSWKQNEPSMGLTQRVSELSRLAAQPWQVGCWYGPGHTCELDFDPIHQQALLVPAGGLQSGDPYPLPQVQGDLPGLLFLIPLNASEFAQHSAGEGRLALPDDYRTAGFLPPLPCR